MMKQYGENKFGKVSQLSLRAGYRDGRTILEDVYFTAPYKIMKPFEMEDGGIQIMPLCASAGIMKGDCQKFDYYVCSGAKLEVLSQSFEKIHKMDGGSASREIKIQVEPNAVLSYYPQPVIPFAESAFDSDMEIRLADATSKLFLLDVISCGRAAAGERFAYRRFSSKVRIYRGDQLIYRDNARYEPAKMPMEGIGMYEGYSHMANIFLSAAVDEFGSVDMAKTLDIQEQIWAVLEAEAECEGGVTRLASGDLTVRVFGNRAQVLQMLAEKIKRTSNERTLVLSSVR